MRVYWDEQELPAIECPLPDFFAVPWLVDKVERPTRGPLLRVNSLPVSVNPNCGFNCFWGMLFRQRCLMTLENIDPTNDRAVYYQLNYTLTDVPDDCAYFHAQFRRVNPLPYGEVYTIVDQIRGRGHYVGTSMG